MVSWNPVLENGSNMNLEYLSCWDPAMFFFRLPTHILILSSWNIYQDDITPLRHCYSWLIWGFFLFNEWCFLINSDIVDLVHIHGWKRGNIGHYHVEKCLLPVINPLILMWCICTKCYEFSKCWPVLFQHISSELYSLSVYHILLFNFSECGLAFCKNVWKREVFFKMSCLSNDDEDDKFLSPICDFSAFILGISLLHQASNLLKILKVNFTACSRLGKNIGN